MHFRRSHRRGFGLTVRQSEKAVARISTQFSSRRRGIRLSGKMDVGDHQFLRSHRRGVGGLSLQSGLAEHGFDDCCSGKRQPRHDHG